MNNNDRIVDDNNRKLNDDNRIANERVITEEDRVIKKHMAEDPDYLEVGDKTRIVDDNARRMGADGHLGDDALILENERIDDNPTHRDTNRVVNDRDGIDGSEVKHMSDESKADLNADPITGAPGSHPVGTAVGGVGGAVAGAAIGSMAGPLGTLIGGAIGAVAGGGAGHASAEAIDPTREEAYWRAEHANANYYKEGYDFDRDMHPAYAVGYANRGRYPADARFEDHEDDLRRSWEEVKGDSRMDWNDARMASHDAWVRVS